ncbi:MAG: S1 RNA-binding domain-containing protein [Candidatus Sumerlaeaceae bacterium]
MPETNPTDENIDPILDAGTLAGGESEQFDDLMSDYLESMSELEVGQLAKATVVEIKKDQVLLDVGDKAEGVADVREFTDFKGNVTVQPGQQIEVVIESRDADTGQVNVSYRKARQRVEWNRVVEAFEKGHTIRGQVVRALKNGVLVDAGVPCFLPASQLDVNRVEDLETFVGQDVECYVIDVDRQRRRGVLSRRRLLAEEQKKKRADILAGLEEGQTLEGRVKSILDFGVFVDMGGIDGLVPREEVAWEKRVNLSDVLKQGVRYKFKIIGIDRDRERVTLSRRQLKPDPWQKIETDYPRELAVKGTVTNLTNNCAYVVLADGVEGRIHRNNLSWNPSIKKPSDLLKKNAEVQATVLDYDNDKRLLELGVRQLTSDPWENIEGRFPPKSRQTVTISDVVSFGAFVQLDEHTKGLIHISDMSYDRNFKDPKQLVKPGDEVEVLVLKIDKEARRINFGMKQLEEDPFTAFIKKHPSGSTVTGKIKCVASFGAFVELAPSLEGLLHISQWSNEKLDSLENVAKPGDEVTVKIIKVEKPIKKISLSRKAQMHDEERREVQQYKQSSPAKATTSLGSLLKNLNIDVKH